MHLISERQKVVSLRASAEGLKVGGGNEKVCTASSKWSPECSMCSFILLSPGRGWSGRHCGYRISLIIVCIPISSSWILVGGKVHIVSAKIHYFSSGQTTWQQNIFFHFFWNKIKNFNLCQPLFWNKHSSSLQNHHNATFAITVLILNKEWLNSALLLTVNN